MKKILLIIFLFIGYYAYPQMGNWDNYRPMQFIFNMIVTNKHPGDIWKAEKILLLVYVDESPKGKKISFANILGKVYQEYSIYNTTGVIHPSERNSGNNYYYDEEKSGIRWETRDKNGREYRFEYLYGKELKMSYYTGSSKEQYEHIYFFNIR